MFTTILPFFQPQRSLYRKDSTRKTYTVCASLRIHRYCLPKESQWLIKYYINLHFLAIYIVIISISQVGSLCDNKQQHWTIHLLHVTFLVPAALAPIHRCTANGFLVVIAVYELNKSSSTGKLEFLAIFLCCLTFFNVCIVNNENISTNTGSGTS